MRLRYRRWIAWRLQARFRRYLARNWNLAATLTAIAIVIAGTNLRFTISNTLSQRPLLEVTVYAPGLDMSQQRPMASMGIMTQNLGDRAAQNAELHIREATDDFENATIQEKIVHLITPLHPSQKDVQNILFVAGPNQNFVIVCAVYEDEYHRLYHDGSPYKMVGFPESFQRPGVYSGITYATLSSDAHDRFIKAHMCD
jgi:hypothetical protein